jgi:hypothetical protein
MKQIKTKQIWDFVANAASQGLELRIEVLRYKTALRIQADSIYPDIQFCPDRLDIGLHQYFFQNEYYYRHCPRFLGCHNIILEWKASS